VGTTGSSELAPPIPFQDEIALKKALKTGPLYQEILSRIDSSAPANRRMPPNGTLFQTDRETIRAYVDTLMR
jgi:hypothetical protein